MKIKSKKIISVSDWDDLVTSTYSRPYNFQQQNGCQSRGTVYLNIPSIYADDFENNTIPDEINGDMMGVSFTAWLTRDPQEWNGESGDDKWLDLFWERNFYPDLQTVANDLYDKGLIPEGEYGIEIDW